MKRLAAKSILQLSSATLVVAILCAPQDFANASSSPSTDGMLTSSRSVMPIRSDFYYGPEKVMNHSARKTYSVGARRTDNDDLVLRFEVRPGERADFDGRDRDRSEATDGIKFPKDVDIWNAYRVKLGKNFDIPDGPSSWFIIGQWHGSDNDKRSPYIAAEMQGNDLVFLSRYLNAQGKPSVREMYRQRDVPRDQWLNIVMKHRVDATNGLLDIWLNGRQVVNFDGPLGYWDHAQAGYFKFGIYRSYHDADAIVEYRDLLTTTQNSLLDRASLTN